MEYAKTANIRRTCQKNVVLPRKPEPVNVEEELLVVKQQCVQPFDLSRLTHLRRQMYILKVRSSSVTLAEFEKLLRECGVKVTHQVAEAVLGSDPGDIRKVMEGIDRVGCSEERRMAIRESFRMVDTEGQDSVEYRKLRDANPAMPRLLEMFIRPLEKHVSIREYENVLIDLSVLYPDDDTFMKLISFTRTIPKPDKCRVLVRFISGEERLVELTAAPGTMKQDKTSLLRRLALHGIRDVQSLTLQ
jgi:Ca2+-binding EF-hand superfamily protein